MRKQPGKKKRSAAAKPAARKRNSLHWEGEADTRNQPRKPKQQPTAKPPKMPIGKFIKASAVRLRKVGKAIVIDLKR